MINHSTNSHSYFIQVQVWRYGYDFNINANGYRGQKKENPRKKAAHIFTCNVKNNSDQQFVAIRHLYNNYFINRFPKMAFLLFMIHVGMSYAKTKYRNIFSSTVM